MERRSLKFIPVRGRKPLKIAGNHALAYVEIYPREGTETWALFVIIATKELKFIPVRGLKRVT